MFGRQSLREFVRCENESLREFIRNLHEETLEFIRNLHEETLLAQEETREVNRESLLRNEKVYTSVIAKMEENGEEIRANTERTEAGTQAILRLLDRFDEPGGAAA